MRYYAFRNLVDMGCENWLPASKRLRSSDFYSSLIVYEKFVKSEIDSSTLKLIASSHSRRSGDHWHWLTLGPEGPAK